MKRFSSFSILFKPISLAVLLTCVFAATAFGQTTTGTISGTITDPSGAVVAGATITVTNPATGAERSVTSNEQGAFDVPALQPGKYTITVDEYAQSYTQPNSTCTHSAQGFSGKIRGLP